jgi:cyclic di-GMP phosphodiesterase
VSITTLKHAQVRIKSLEKKLRKRTNELTQSQAEIIQRLSMAAEHRDPETGDHIHRMSHYCYCIALANGFSEKDSRLLLNASPMHDIGKLGIPDSVLLNPKELTAEEWVIMKSHAAIGERILSGSTSKLVQLGMVVAGTHHEKWNGTGYPNQLAGESIPIWGRIGALADVFDAMTTKRVYQKPVSADKAFAYIKDQKGKHFDPGLTDLFLNIKPKILEIKNRFPD